MVPLINILLEPVISPLAHGAVGFWDEVLNIVPLVFGAGLLAYLYFGKRKHRTTDAQPSETEANPVPPTDEPPRA